MIEFLGNVARYISIEESCLILTKGRREPRASEEPIHS
jgi:hypothetical protein